MINSDIFLELCIAYLLLGDYTDIKWADSVVEPPKKHHTIPTDVLPNASEDLFFVCTNKKSLPREDIKKKNLSQTFRTKLCHTGNCLRVGTLPPL